ncbi:hypothetical protein [Nodosilinea sp. E11]|uniref:HpsJ-like protein, cyanoexosortase C-associated n=1 Tax=Nodosilinea sp. E11 TaxID=3037479 RepID=UPI0029341030|nr:hypothetical protein [Nodosilinea sp. E11]WOD37912.1 hypothetical protein RRF56_17000 [Nodosilinea sp. E11]
MANTQMPWQAQGVVTTQKLAFIVSGICLIGFVIDILVIGLPPNPLSPQWRLNFLQQVSERSLLLFVGSALLVYSKLNSRLQQLKVMAIGCVLAGLLLGLSSLLVIKDTLTLQHQAIANLDTQASELRARITQGREDPALNQQLDDDAFTNAIRSVDNQATILKQDAQIGSMKTLISSSGNLLLVGGGLIGVGRLGLLKSLGRRRLRRA